METVGIKPTQLRLGGEFASTKSGEGMTTFDKPKKSLAEKNAWHKLPPTDKQIRSITKMCIALKIDDDLEERVSNRMEARDTMFELQRKLRTLGALKSSGGPKKH